MTAEPALTATILPLLGDRGDVFVAGGEGDGLGALGGLAGEGDVEEAARVLERHGRGRERQAGAGGAFGLLGRFFGLDGLLILLVAVAVFIRGGVRRGFCGLRRLHGFGLRCLRLGVGGLRGGFERRLAVERRPAEAAERQQRPAEHSEAENDADRGHHPLRDGVDIAALRGLRRVGAVLRRDSRAGTQALAGIAAGGAGAAGLLPQTLAGGGLFGPARGCLAAWAGFFPVYFLRRGARASAPAGRGPSGRRPSGRKADTGSDARHRPCRSIHSFSVP